MNQHHHNKEKSFFKYMGYNIGLFLVILAAWFATEWWTENMMCYPKSDVPPQENEIHHKAKHYYPVLTNYEPRSYKF